MKAYFSYSLRESLKLKYGKIPSAEVVARDFNLRASGTSPVTQESARRWMRGETLPKIDHMIVLVKWLDLDLNEIFVRLTYPQSVCESTLSHFKACDELIGSGSCRLINEVRKKTPPVKEKIQVG